MTAAEFKEWREQLFPDKLASVRIENYPRDQKEPWPGDPYRDWELPKRFKGDYGDPEQQRFTRAELRRWLGVVKQPTIYAFEPIEQAGEADVQTTSCPAGPKGEAAKDRRARLLAWLEAEEKIRKHGALQRVTVRERAIRPTADRSNVGRDIKKGREERDEFRRGGALLQVTRL